MMLHHQRFLGSLVASALLSSCSVPSDLTGFEPLEGAVPVAVSLKTTYDIPLSALPRLQLSGIARGIDAVWEVAVFGCLTQSASASQAGAVVEIRLERAGNPLANCAPVSSGYRYAARVSGLAPGRYEVRFVDKFVDQLPNQIGRSSVLVSE
jgi:hypothetical protein